MARRGKKATVVGEMSPRRVVMFRNVDRWFHCVMWEERSTVEPKELLRLHYLYVDHGPVRHEIAAPSDQRHLMAQTGSSTVEHFERYLRERLQKFGGNASAYDALNVPKPEQPTEAAPERVEAHGDMYARAATALGTTVEELRKKYGHLNPGLQMMNLRNRMRAKGLTL